MEMAASITMPNFSELTTLQPISIKVFLWGDERAYYISQEIKNMSNIEATYIPQIYYPTDQIFKIIEQYKNKIAPDQYVFLCPMVDIEECLSEINWFINDGAISYSLPLHPVNVQKRDTDLRRILEKLQGQNNIKLVNVCPGPISWEKNCIFKAESIHGESNVNFRAAPYNLLSETFASARTSWNEQLVTLTKLYDKHNSGPSKNSMQLFSYVTLITDVRETAYNDWANGKGLFPVKGYWKRDGIFPTKQINDWLLHKWMGLVEDIFRDNHQNPRKYLYKKGFSRPSKQELDQFNSDKRQNLDLYRIDSRGITPFTPSRWNDLGTRSKVPTPIENTQAMEPNVIRPHRTPPQIFDNTTPPTQKQQYHNVLQRYDIPTERRFSAPTVDMFPLQSEEKLRSHSADRPTYKEMPSTPYNPPTTISAIIIPISTPYTPKRMPVSGTHFQYEEIELPIVSQKPNKYQEEEYNQNIGPEAA